MSGASVLGYLRATASPRLRIRSTRGIVKLHFVKIGGGVQQKSGERVKPTHSFPWSIVAGKYNPHRIYGARRET
jgi:hypothetical protein